MSVNHAGTATGDDLSFDPVWSSDGAKLAFESYASDLTATADTNSLYDGRSKTFADLAPGLYAAAETVPTGWSLETAICEDGSPVTTVHLDPGEELVCTFTNEAD